MDTALDTALACTDPCAALVLLRALRWARGVASIRFDREERAVADMAGRARR